MTQLFPIAAITDEFSPDIDVAARSMAAIGMTGAELRMVFGKNIIDLSPEELEQAKRIVEGYGLKIVSIASPLLKCVLPDAPEVDSRFQQDVFASVHGYEDQPALAERAFRIATFTGARIIRVFSFWRTVNPDACFDRVVAALAELARQAEPHGLVIGLENEHACNVGTGAEAARILAAVNHPNLKLVWDPCNAHAAGEIAYPDGYRLLPPGSIAHVHAKDCRMEGLKPVFGPLGTMDVDWKGQLQQLAADGYQGFISLETHWKGPGGDKHLASVISGRNLAALVTR